jgi:serine/threonine-protein kinase
MRNLWASSLALRGLAVLVFVCVQVSVFTGIGQRAAAQAAGADKAMAEALFDRGLTLMRQGHFEQACVQLEHSQAIERGIGTLLYLAECYEKSGKTASAWATFREAASAARAENQLDRARAGSARADRLEPSLSRLTIHVGDGKEAAQLTVRRNGQLVPPAAFGVALPSDPGPQRIEVSAPRRLPWSLTVTLAPNGSSLTVDVPELAVDPDASQLTAAAPEATPAQRGAENTAPLSAPAAATRPVNDTTTGSSWQRPLGIGLGAAGIVAIGVGSYFGARALSKNSDLEKACPRTECAATNQPLEDSAKSAATWSTGLFVAGGALLAAGSIVFFTAPSERAVAVGVQARLDGVLLRVGGHL